VTTPSFDIVPLDEVPEGDVVAAIAATFGPRSMAWFHWKHRENPAGPSLGWVARDEDGIVGVRLLLRWNLRLRGRRVRAVRPVDTVTVPRARRRGVFRVLTETALDEVARRGVADIVFNTPNERSRPGYARMGWTALPPVHTGYGIVQPLPGRTLDVSLHPPDHLDRLLPPDRLATARGPRYLAWRYDERSGHAYRLVAPVHADRPALVVYRPARRFGAKTLVVCEAFGEARVLRRLLRAVASRERALFVLLAFGPGALAPPLPVRFPRGSSTLAVRALRELPVDPRDRDAWALDLGDLEDVL